MPATVYQIFETLLLKLFAGQAHPPAKVYMGLSAGGSEVGMTDGNNPPVQSGYNRKEIATSGLVVSGGTLTIPTQTWTFLATPSQPNADTWFVADSAAGGYYYFSGPLNAGGASGVLSAAITRGSYTMTVLTTTAAQLSVGDTLKLGSACAKNLEYVVVTAIANDNGGSTDLTVYGQGSAVTYAHPSGEGWSRVGGVRSYVAGWVETVDAQVTIANQAS